MAGLNDSDCLIQEQHISCITLDDSHDEREDIEEGEIDEDSVSSVDNICEIKFSNATNYNKFGALITELLKEKLNEMRFDDRFIEIVAAEKESGTILQVKYCTDGTIQPSTPVDKSVNKSDTFEKELSPDLSGISELFTIDTNPAEKLDSVKVPSYKRGVKDVLLDEQAAAHKKQKQEENNMKMPKTSNCFNCGEMDHNIKECPMPHNARRIKMAKKNFSKTERYHVDVEQRFAHLRPGCISDKLREAMGLRKGELPFFFYRMRILGYPPGWLEDAKVEHSGINLFNSDGSKILHSDEDDADVDSNNHKYNISKIIDFPGFNQDPGENFYDDYKYHNVPPLDRNQFKEEFVKTLGDNVVKGYKRKKLKNFPKSNNDDSVNDSFHVQVSDMEIEDPDTATANIEFVRPPPPPEPPKSHDDVPPPPPPPLSPITTPQKLSLKSPKSPDSPLSPSLAELERKKNQLLQELQTSVIEIDDSLVDEIIALDTSVENVEGKRVEPNFQEENKDATVADAHTSNENTQNTSEDVGKTSSEINPDDIEKSYMGTPVLKFSPYDNLPNGENFKVGVSDVINFENLPDSTGKYENMKELIKKVRTVKHKLDSDD